MLGLGFLKYHTYVYQVIRDTIKNTKPFHKLIKTLITIVGTYFKVVIINYKNIISDRQRIIRKQNNIKKKLNQEIQRAIKFLKFIDKQLDVLGIHPRKKEHYWNKFIKKGKVREDLYNQLLTQLK